MTRLIGLTALAAAVGLAACTTVNHSLSQAQANEHAESMKALTQAVAVMRPTQGNDARGVIYFAQENGQVTIEGRIEGLEPGSTHGFHIHEYGDTTAADGTAAGGHYNPEGHKHGLPPDQPRHAGDLGNITADDNGVASFKKTVANISIAGVKNPIIGRGVIVHGKRDDGGQPTGNAGARIAQGVVGMQGEK
jgi:Cu-Zn family superoxide dismutase